MGNLETVALLIEKGASVNAVTTDNKTPLHCASEHGKFGNSRFTNRERSIC
jgi:ankyrin repeat protein